MEIIKLIETIGSLEGCIVYPPSGLPTINTDHLLPDDLYTFYTLCGGIDLFEYEGFSISIVPPQKLILANPVIFTGVSQQYIDATRDHISWSWYIAAVGKSSQYITIDLSGERLGRCYDSFWDRHPGNSPIIAKSFTDFVYRLIQDRGNTWYWMEPGFVSLGSPYE